MPLGLPPWHKDEGGRGLDGGRGRMVVVRIVFFFSVCECEFPRLCVCENGLWRVCVYCVQCILFGRHFTLAWFGI